MSLGARPRTPRKPRLGFLGMGWIGRLRMQDLLATDDAVVIGIADPDADMRRAGSELAPGALTVSSLDALLEMHLDGVVIATPSALHADQAVACLARGLAVFCQKPLGRTATEAARVVKAAREADRLLGVDLSYRYTDALARVRDLAAVGSLGEVYAVELVFHNAYGPDKAWFYDRSLSGGGCVIDLGIHLVDAALWMLDFPEVATVTSRLFHRGRLLGPNAREVEDYAVARLDTHGGATVQLACSWNLPAGRDAVIAARVYGTEGGASMENVDGSFFDFVADHHLGTQSERLCGPPDAWGGRALCAWARRLAHDRAFDPEARRHVDVAEVLDRIYGR